MVKVKWRSDIWNWCSTLDHHINSFYLWNYKINWFDLYIL